MANGDGIVDHHWETTQEQGRQLDRQGEQIGEIQSDVSGIKSGVNSLTTQTTAGFTEMRHQYQISNKPKIEKSWVPIASLFIGVVVVLGSVMGFTFSIITNNIQRENDLRFTNITRVVSLVSNHMEVLDLARAEDAFDKGYALAKQEDLIKKLDHIDDLDHRRDAVVTTLREASAANEVKDRAIGEYMQEHVNKEGSTGHPQAERIISGGVNANRILPE